MSASAKMRRPNVTGSCDVNDMEGRVMRLNVGFRSAWLKHECDSQHVYLHRLRDLLTCTCGLLGH